jgi:fimbrial chaperone protein
MRTLHRSLSCAGLVIALALTGGVAHAGTFAVEPTTIDLATRGVPAELTISNRGKLAARFEAKVVTWRQDADGTMQFAPTTDLVVYPTLFTVEPGGKRSIRIATTSGPTANERSYRIFVEELPPLRAGVDLAASTTTSISMRTRMGVPIFVAPMKAQIRGEVRGVVGGDGVQVSIENRGTLHVKAATVRVIAKNQDGSVVFDRSQKSWYVLAAGTRTHTLAFEAGECAQIRELAIDATTDHGTWKTTLAMPAAACHGTR